MTMTASLLLDLVTAALLVFFFIRGFRRGLVLMLCSLLAIFLAFAGGWYLCHHYDVALQEKLQPVFYERMLEKYHREAGVQQGELSEQQEQIQEETERAAQAIFTQKSATLSYTAASAILFLGGFLLVLLFWTLLCHALDLVARLPGLHLLNKSLGGLLGLAGGCLLLTVCRWVLCDLLSLIPAQAAADSYLLSFLSKIPFVSLLGI